MAKSSKEGLWSRRQDREAYWRVLAGGPATAWRCRHSERHGLCRDSLMSG